MASSGDALEFTTNKMHKAPFHRVFWHDGVPEGIIMDQGHQLHTPVKRHLSCALGPGFHPGRFLSRAFSELCLYYQLITWTTVGPCKCLTFFHNTFKLCLCIHQLFEFSLCALFSLFVLYNQICSHTLICISAFLLMHSQPIYLSCQSKYLRKFHAINLKHLSLIFVPRLKLTLMNCHVLWNTNSFLSPV